MSGQVKRLERAIARRRVLSRLLQEEATLECFAAMRSARADLGLQLSRTTLGSWREAEDAMERCIAALHPAIDAASEMERRAIDCLLSQLDLPLAWRGSSAWLPEWIAVVFQQWTTWIDEEERRDVVDLRTLVLLVNRAAHVRVIETSDQYRRALGLPPSATTEGPISIRPGLVEPFREIVDKVLAEADVDEEQRDAALAEFARRMLVADHWSTPVLEALETEARDPHLPSDLPIPPVYLGHSGATTAKRRVDEFAEETKAFIAARSAAIDNSTVTEKRRPLIERDADLWYHNTIADQSIRMLSLAAFGVDDRRTEIRTRIRLAEAVLGVGESE